MNHRCQQLGADHICHLGADHISHLGADHIGHLGAAILLTCITKWMMYACMYVGVMKHVIFMAFRTRCLEIFPFIGGNLSFVSSNWFKLYTLFNRPHRELWWFLSRDLFRFQQDWFILLYGVMGLWWMVCNFCMYNVLLLKLSEHKCWHWFRNLNTLWSIENVHYIMYKFF